MWSINFLGQNINFAVSLFAALVFFAVFWLYFDAWLTKRNFNDTLQWLGFLLLSLSFLAYATITEQSVLGKSSISDAMQAASFILSLLGFASIIVGQIKKPLQLKPELKGLDEAEFKTEQQPEDKKPTNSNLVIPFAVVGVTGFGKIINILPPVGALMVAGLFWRRATTGLEKHLKPVAVSFLFIFGFELLSLTSLWQDTTNPSLSKFIASFSWLWFVNLALLFMGSVVLGRWVWRYLVERFVSQLFMVFTATALAIFLVTTVSFTYLLVDNIQKSTLNNLETSANVLNYAINNKKTESLSNTETVAENPVVATAIVAKDRPTLANVTNSFLAAKKQSGLTLVNEYGEVVYRVEDPNNWGDSLSSDTLVQRALIGQSLTSVGSKSGVLAPVVYIRSAVPVYNSSHQIVGAAIGTLEINNAFVDGVKQATGLDSSVYSANTLSATTFLAPDGKSRSIGTKETNNSVETKVIKQGNTFKGSSSVLNREYSVVYVPLKDADNVNAGMLFIGQPKDEILRTASQSIELTFITSVILIIISIVPAYKLAKSIAKQVE